MKSFNPLPYAFSLALLILAGAVAYYLIVFVPEKNKKENDLATEKQTQYTTCMANARTQYDQEWIARCRANDVTITKGSSGQDECTMKDIMSKSVTDDYKNNQDTCLKLYLGK